MKRGENVSVRAIDGVNCLHRLTHQRHYAAIQEWVEAGNQYRRPNNGYNGGARSGVATVQSKLTYTITTTHRR